MRSPDCLPVPPDPSSPGQMSDKRSSERAFPRGEKSENDAGKERSARQASERVRAFSVFGVVEREVRTSSRASASTIMAAMSATEPTAFTKRRTSGGQRRPRPGAAGRRSRVTRWVFEPRCEARDASREREGPTGKESQGESASDGEAGRLRESDAADVEMNGRASGRLGSGRARRLHAAPRTRRSAVQGRFPKGQINLRTFDAS